MLSISVDRQLGKVSWALGNLSHAFFPLCVCDGKRLNAEATSLKGFLGGLLQNAFDLPQAELEGGSGEEEEKGHVE